VIARGSNNPKAQRGSPNVIEASQGVEILKVPTGRVDRSMGDVHPSGNPHYTLDPANLPIVTRNIAAGLARVAPEHARVFEANRVARETGAKVLVVPQTPGAINGTDDYVAHLDYIVTAIAHTLSLTTVHPFRRSSGTRLVPPKGEEASWRG